MKLRFLAALMLSCSTLVCAQRSEGPYAWIEDGKLWHGSGTATFSCNHPDAILEAIRTVREEYGWNVSFEGAPLFSKYDRVDNSSPKWRAAHPNAPGHTRAAGGRFSSTYPEFADMSQPDAEEAVLNKIVADYNSSGNPGRYAVLKLQKGIYDVVGISLKNDDGVKVSVQPVLETSISIPEQERSIFDTIQVILDEITKKTGKKGIIMTFSPNGLIYSPVELGGKNVSARSLLLKALAAADPPRLWDFAYDPNPNADVYLINPINVMKRPRPVDAFSHH